MIIPIESLSDIALKGLIEEYCLRDWGLNAKEDSIEQYFEEVKRALEQGELLVVYSQAHQSAHIVHSREFGDSAPELDA